MRLRSAAGAAVLSAAGAPAGRGRAEAGDRNARAAARTQRRLDRNGMAAIFFAPVAAPLFLPVSSVSVAGRGMAPRSTGGLCTRAGRMAAVLLPVLPAAAAVRGAHAAGHRRRFRRARTGKAALPPVMPADKDGNTASLRAAASLRAKAFW